MLDELGDQFCSSEKINGNKTKMVSVSVPSSVVPTMNNPTATRVVTKPSVCWMNLATSFVLAKKLMVTKPFQLVYQMSSCFVLAKKLMVTKLMIFMIGSQACFVLAKKLMVTKPLRVPLFESVCFVLAKKLMVTKPQIHIIINLRFYKM